MLKMIEAFFIHFDPIVCFPSAIPIRLTHSVFAYSSKAALMKHVGIIYKKNHLRINQPANQKKINVQFGFYCFPVCVYANVCQ